LSSSTTSTFGYCKGQGLTWSAPKPDAESPSDQVVQIHSQGQAQDNSRWFICHDFPNDKMTTELIVTVEDGYDVSSNGRLLKKEQPRLAGRAGTGSRTSRTLRTS
jgi:hypothetical protein